MPKDGPLTGVTLEEGAYRLYEILGQGGMGVVYRGLQVKLDRTVAVKLLLLNSLPEKERAEAAHRLHDEARAAARIRHRHLVEIIAMGEDKKHGPYIVYEFLPGGTLKDYVEQEGPMEWKSFYKKVGRGLLQALSELHEVGVIHRDIKPENMLADDKGRFKLGDLGLALFQGRSANTIAGTLYGTPGYLAPERVAETSEKLGIRSDLYSAAVLMVEMVTGTLPFQGRSSVEIISDQLKRKFDGNSLSCQGLPRSVSRVLARALARNPAKRPATAKEFIKLLDDVTFSKKSQSRIKTQQAEKPGNKRPYVAIGLIVAVLCLFLAHKFLLSHRPSGKLPTKSIDLTKHRKAALSGKSSAAELGKLVLQSDVSRRMKLAAGTSPKVAGLLYLARYCEQKKSYHQALVHYLKLLAEGSQNSVEIVSILSACAKNAALADEWLELADKLKKTQNKYKIEFRPMLRYRRAEALIASYISETHGRRAKNSRARSGSAPMERIEEALTLLRREYPKELWENCFSLHLTALGLLGRDKRKAELVGLINELISNDERPVTPKVTLVTKAAAIMGYAYLPSDSDMNTVIGWLDKLKEKETTPDQKALLLAYKSAMTIKSTQDQGEPNRYRAKLALTIVENALRLAKEPSTRAYVNTTRAWILARNRKKKKAWSVLMSIPNGTVAKKHRWWYLRVKGGLEVFKGLCKEAAIHHRQAIDCAPPELTHYIRLVHTSTMAASAGLFIPGQ